MSERWPIFDIKRDIEIEQAGGFFCHACLIGKSLDDQSPDPRYCQGCYEFLLKEAQLAPARGKQTWRPVPKRVEALPVKAQPVTKIADKGMTPVGIMLQRRGRPKKEGKVSRMTEWRRQKQEQGVLI